MGSHAPKKPLWRRLLSGNMLRMIIIFCIAVNTGLHITLIVVPNWWYYDFAEMAPRNSLSGIKDINGGLWRLCQHYGEDAILYLLETRRTSCFYYGQDFYGENEIGNNLHEVAEVAHVDGYHVPITRGCMLASCCLNLVALILVSVACRVRYRRGPMMMSFFCMLTQCMLVMGAVITAHNWITSGTWRDFNEYGWCFWWSCYLMGPYIIVGLMSLWSACTAYSELNRDGESEDDLSTSVSSETFRARQEKKVDPPIELDERETFDHTDSIEKPPKVFIEGVESAEV